MYQYKLCAIPSVLNPQVKGEGQIYSVLFELYDQLYYYVKLTDI